MDTKKIVMGVISVAVAIIVLMSMIPIFTDAGASEDTFTNEGYFRMSKITTDDTYSIRFDKTPNTLTINGTNVYNVADLGVPSQVTVFAGYTDTNITLGRLQSGLRLLCNSSELSGSVGFTADYTEISATGGVITITSVNGDTTTTKTTSYTEAYVFDMSGPYTMKKSNVDAYLKEDSFYNVGYTAISDTYVGIEIEGNISDGATVKQVITNLDVTMSEPVIHYSEVNSYEGLYKFSNVTFDITYNDSDTPATYSYVIVPYEVTAERSVHASPVEATLIGLIPLLMMVGIMLTAVGLFIAKYRKN